MKSIRKVLAQALMEACKEAGKLTGKSINALPEYFLVVKSAEFINAQFKTFTFSMEEPLFGLCEAVGIDHGYVDKECRLAGSARADLVLKSKASGKNKHVVEFKRSLNIRQIRKDAIRLAGLCAYAPSGHRMEKNFLVVVSVCGAEKFKERTTEIRSWIVDNFSGVEVKFEPVDLGCYESTRRKSEGKALCGGVWEFAYKG